MKLRIVLMLAVSMLLAVGFVACGGNDEDDGATVEEPATPAPDETETEETETEAEAPEGETLEVSADPNGALEFEQETLSVAAGPVTVELTNESQVPHDVVIEQGGEDIAETETITDSTTSTSTQLDAGDYQFYCSVQGHREAGMEGELTVQ